ncbi:MAG: RIP metalloprotease RseP [Deltaproteobacteria bacterium]|nr:RIP metalloprotease RseP [Deltaproteobacteria bacterium]
MNLFLYYVLPFVLVLGVLIFFHELGHFLVAKFFGVKVLKFSLGFGSKVIGRKVGETEYLISMIPLGGYVKMLGEGDEEKPLPVEEEARSFANQHVFKRIAIVSAGPLFNFLLAFFLFALVFVVTGEQVMQPEIGQVREGSPAEKAGLLKGDHIISVQGIPVDSWEDLKTMVRKSAGKPLRLTILREGRTIEAVVVPEMSTVKNLFGESIPSPLIGVVASGAVKTLQMGPFEAVAHSAAKTWEITRLTFVTIVKLLQRVVPLKTVGGPILIGQMAGQLARENFGYLIPFMAVISVNLAVLNLLPVPVLDGGFILFLLVELVLGKPLSIKKREFAQKIGLFLLVTLMIFVLYNDVTRLLE